MARNPYEHDPLFPGSWYWVAGYGPMQYRRQYPDPSVNHELEAPGGGRGSFGREHIRKRQSQRELDQYRENCRVKGIEIPAMMEGEAPVAEYKVVQACDQCTVTRILIVRAPSLEEARDFPNDQEVLARQQVVMEGDKARTLHCEAIDDDWTEYRALGYYSTKSSREKLVSAEEILALVEETSDYDSLVEQLASLCGWRKRSEPPA